MTGTGEPATSASRPLLVADAMLGKLARWLRILGYDTLYDPHASDHCLARLARAQGRILLTRDTALARRRGVRPLFIRSEKPEEQLAQVVDELGLCPAEILSRCPVCNDQLEEVPRSWAWGYVPPYTFCTQREFRLCPSCNRFYWRGTHWERIHRAIAHLSARACETKSEKTKEV